MSVEEKPGMNLAGVDQGDELPQTIVYASLRYKKTSKPGSGSYPGISLPAA